MAKKKEGVPVEATVNNEVVAEETVAEATEVAPETTEEVVAEVAPEAVVVEEVAPEEVVAEVPAPPTSFEGKDFQKAADGNPYIPPGLADKL